MSYQCFELDQIDGIAHLKLNRPEKRNSMIPAFWQELPSIVEKLDAAGKTRVLVISSTGKHFCAGMDLGVFSNTPQGDQGQGMGRQREKFRHFVLALQNSLSALENARFPVLTAIQGGCLGGGLDLIAASDCRYCTEDAYFTIAETPLGLVADLGTLQRLPHLIPMGLAKEMAYTGRKLSAQEALQCGLVNQVFADHQSLVDGVMEMAKSIACHSPLVVNGCKEMINYTRDHSVEESLKFMAIWQTGMFFGEELMESFAAKGRGEAPTYKDVSEIQPLFE